jgi:hypothetical protein
MPFRNHRRLEVQMQRYGGSFAKNVEARWQAPTVPPNFDPAHTASHPSLK